MKIWANELSDQLRARRKGLHLRSGALSARLNGWGKTILFGLAGCLAIIASGCGKNATDPAAQTSGTGTSQTSVQLTISASNLSFGSVQVNTAVTQSLTLTSTGTAPVAISSGTVTGAGFTIVAQTFPITLSPGQSLTVQVQFDPTTAGALTGQLTISSNSTTGGTDVVALSGTGTAAAHEVALSWNAPISSPDPVAGYNIYRSTGSGSFVLINSSPDLTVAYTDFAVTSGVAYSYQVTSVDFSGIESVPSNQVSVTIP